MGMAFRVSWMCLLLVAGSVGESLAASLPDTQVLVHQVSARQGPEPLPEPTVLADTLSAPGMPAPAMAATAMAATGMPATGMPATAMAATAMSPTAMSATEMEAIKQAALDLDRELLLLEEALLFPASTQVIVFVSMDVGEYFALDAVKLKIDGKLVASYLYTPGQARALHRGGYQRLFVGNVKAGDHEVTAFFTGTGSHNRPLQRALSLTLSKAQRANAIELRIMDSTEKQQPIFDSQQWLL